MSDIIFFLKKLISILILPPLLPFILIFSGLLIRRCHPRLGNRLTWAGVIIQALTIFPVTVGWMLHDLESTPMLDMQKAGTAQAIVIVGAGKRSYAPEFGGETINRLALERLRYGARLAKETGLPILVSGGAPTGKIPEAALMQTSLEQDFSIPARWVESASRDTRENAVFSAAQLKAEGINTIILVTHAVHMKRTQEEFEAQGLHVLAAPTAWLLSPRKGESVWAMLPNANSAYAAWYAAHEWLGLIVYRLSR